MSGSNRRNTRHGQHARRKALRVKIDKILLELNTLGQERLDLANSFLEGVDVTDMMYAQLEAGTYVDKEFQVKWTRFQKIQRRMTELKNEGGDLAVENKNLMKFSDYVKLLAKFDTKRTTDEQIPGTSRYD